MGNNCRVIVVKILVWYKDGKKFLYKYEAHTCSDIPVIGAVIKYSFGIPTLIAWIKIAGWKNNMLKTITCDYSYMHRHHCSKLDEDGKLIARIF